MVLERSIVINAPVEKVFAYIEDPRNDLEWLPNLIEVKDVIGRGVGSHSRWTFKVTGLHFRGESMVTEFVLNERFVVQTKGNILSTWIWTFEPLENGQTKVNLVLKYTYTFPVPILGKVIERLTRKKTERDADLAMANIKRILQQV